jgi:hypothetical protein
MHWPEYCSRLLPKIKAMQKTTEPKIHIRNPCHKDWKRMEIAEQGRFCKSCSQIVTDFTGMTTPELIDYFEINKGRTGCGRFRDDQMIDFVPTFAHFRLRLRYFVALFLLPFLTFFSMELKAEQHRDVGHGTTELKIGPGPTVSHYYGKLLPRRKKKKHRKGRYSTGMGSF